MATAAATAAVVVAFLPWFTSLLLLLFFSSLPCPRWPVAERPQERPKAAAGSNRWWRIRITLLECGSPSSSSSFSSSSLVGHSTGSSSSVGRHLSIWSHRLLLLLPHSRSVGRSGIDRRSIGFLGDESGRRRFFFHFAPRRRRRNDQSIRLSDFSSYPNCMQAGKDSRRQQQQGLDDDDTVVLRQNRPSSSSSSSLLSLMRDSIRAAAATGGARAQSANRYRNFPRLRSFRPRPTVRPTPSSPTALPRSIFLHFILCFADCVDDDGRRLLFLTHIMTIRRNNNNMRQLVTDCCLFVTPPYVRLSYLRWVPSRLDEQVKSLLLLLLLSSSSSSSSSSSKFKIGRKKRKEKKRNKLLLSGKKTYGRSSRGTGRSFFFFFLLVDEHLPVAASGYLRDRLETHVVVSFLLFFPRAERAERKKEMNLNNWRRNENDGRCVALGSFLTIDSFPAPWFVCLPRTF